MERKWREKWREEMEGGNGGRKRVKWRSRSQDFSWLPRCRGRNGRRNGGKKWREEMEGESGSSVIHDPRRRDETDVELSKICQVTTRSTMSLVKKRSYHPPLSHLGKYK